MTVTAPNTQIVGQPLVLECSVTTVSGITSRIDIEWRIDTVILQKVEGISNTLMINGSVLYKAIYNITQVSTLDDDRVFQCNAVINSNPQLTATNSVTLDVTGKLHTYYKCLNF